MANRVTQIPVEIITQNKDAQYFESSLSGSAVNYFRYMYGPITKVSRRGEASLLDFQLVPWNGDFVKLARGNYFTVSTYLYGLWFSGYITNDPDYEYLGKDSATDNPVWGYKYNATAEEYLLNLKPIGIIPPYLNTTQGAILKDLVSRLCPNVFETTLIEDGNPVARYVADPEKYFLEVASQFCDDANYQFFSYNHSLCFRSKSAYRAPVVIDRNSKHFTPSRLELRPSQEPIVNDVVVIGGVEPQSFVTEYFVGDGFTARFPLISSIYGINRNILLDETFDSGDIDNSKWEETDTVQDYLKVDGGYLNLLGGTNDGTFSVYLKSKTIVPLEGVLRVTHGQYDFVSASKGVVASLWTAEPNAALSGCVYGINCAKSGANTVLKPIVNGVVDDSQSLTISDYSHRYIIRTIEVHGLQHRIRSKYSYISGQGIVGYYGGEASSDNIVRFYTHIAKVDPSTGLLVTSYDFVNENLTLTGAQYYGYYVPAASDDLHVTLTGITVSQPLQASLFIKGEGASTYLPKALGPNEMDALDRNTPIATIEEVSGSSKDSLFIPQKYNPNHAILEFFKDSTKQTTSIPQVGDLIKLNYRRAGIAVARVRDTQAIETEATKWGDNGLRTLVKKDLPTSPRTSEECELAASALLGDFGHRHYEGSYTQWSGYEFDSEPRPAQILKFQNLPSPDFPDLAAEEVYEVRSTLRALKPTEIFEHTLTFGRPDRLRKILAGFSKSKDYSAVENDVSIPNTIDVSSVGKVFGPDVLAPSLSAYDATNLTIDAGVAAPSGGSFEARYTDDGWGADGGKNLITRTASQTFTVPRNARNKIVFIRAQDGRNKVLRSEDLTQAVWTKDTGVTVSLPSGTNPDGNTSLLSVVSFPATLGAFVSQDTGIAAAAQYAAFTVGLKGTSGKKVKIELHNGAGAFATSSVTLNGFWQRKTVSGLAGSTGTIKVVIKTDESSTQAVNVTRASMEVGVTVETAYAKTLTTTYGALSRYSAIVRVVFPLVPVEVTSLSGQAVSANKFNVSFTIPSSDYQDIYKIVVRDAGTLVVYGEFLWDGLTFQYVEKEIIYSGTFTSDFTVEVCTYNILGETSSTPLQAVVGFSSTVAAITGLALAERIRERPSDGVRESVIKAVWNAITDPYVTNGGAIQVQWKQEGFSEVVSSVKAPGTAASTGGGDAWSNPNNAKVEDGSAATLTLYVPNHTTQSLTLTNFGASGIPSNATMKGIKVEIKRRKQSGTSAVYADSISLVGVTGVKKADTYGSPWPGSLTFKTYGGPTDLWGIANPTPAMFSASGFGFAVHTLCTLSPGSGGIAAVDFGRVTFYYTVPDGGIGVDWIETPLLLGNQVVDVVGPVIGGLTVYVQARARNKFGFYGSWAGSSIVPDGSAGSLEDIIIEYFGTTPGTAVVTTVETSDPDLGNLVSWGTGGVLQDSGIATVIGGLGKSTQHVLTVATNGTITISGNYDLFTADDVGKVIRIIARSAAVLEDYETTIQSFTSPTEVVVAQAPTITSTTGEAYWFDSSQDDTDVLNAILSSGRRTLTLGKGVYVITGALVNHRATTCIRGEGSWNTAIVSRKSAISTQSLNFTDVMGLRLERFSVVGPGLDVVGGGGIYIAHSDFDNVERLYVDDVYVRHCAANGWQITTPILSTLRGAKSTFNALHGFDVIGGTTTDFINCYATTCVGAGFIVEQGAVDIGLQGCASEATGIGVLVKDSYSVTVDHHDCEEMVDRSFAAPTGAPSLSLLAGGTVPTGAYRMTYAWMHGPAPSPESPESSPITVTSGNQTIRADLGVAASGAYVTRIYMTAVGGAAGSEGFIEDIISVPGSGLIYTRSAAFTPGDSPPTFWYDGHGYVVSNSQKVSIANSHSRALPLTDSRHYLITDDSSEVVIARPRVVQGATTPTYDIEATAGSAGIGLETDLSLTRVLSAGASGMVRNGTTLTALGTAQPVTLTPSTTGQIENTAGNNLILSDSGSFTAGGAIHLRRNGSMIVALERYSDNVSPASVLFKKSRGTATSPTGVSANDLLGAIIGQGMTSALTFGVQPAAVTLRAGEDFTATAQGSYITFETAPTASVTRAERWRINPAGHFLAATDNTVDIGASGASRPRDFFGAGKVQAAKAVISGLNTVTFSATPTFDASLGNTQKITLTGNVTSSTLSNATAGEQINFIIYQDSTGSHTFVWPTNVKGGMTIGSTLSTCSAQSFIFDGTNAYALGAGVLNQ